MDPESPALNEDGEFPEFDINVSYNSEIIKRLNIKLDYIGSNNKNYKVPKKYNYIDKSGYRSIGSDFENLFLDLNKDDNYYNNYVNNIGRSFTFKQGYVDDLKNEKKYF